MPISSIVGSPSNPTRATHKHITKNRKGLIASFLYVDVSFSLSFFVLLFLRWFSRYPIDGSSPIHPIHRPSIFFLSLPLPSLWYFSYRTHFLAVVVVDVVVDVAVVVAVFLGCCCFPKNKSQSRNWMNQRRNLNKKKGNWRLAGASPIPLDEFRNISHLIFFLSLSLSLFLFFFLYFSFSSCCHAGMGLMDGRREGGWCRPHIYTYGEVAAMMSRLFPPPQRVIHIQVHSTGDKTDI